jgi:hypothetical protein
MTLRNHPTDRDAPRVAEPPTEGDYEVWTYEKGAVAMVFFDPDRDAAHKAFRRTKVAAVFVRGNTVLAGNITVTSRLLPTIQRLVIEAKRSPIPAPPSRASAPAPTVVTPEPERVMQPVVEAIPVAIEPDPAPSKAVAETTATPAPPPAEESMPKTTCSKCKKHPIDATTKNTPSGTEGWCRHCRRMESAARKGKHLGGGSRAPQKAAAKPAPATKVTAKPGSSAPAVDDLLALLAREHAVVARLGGIERAERLAEALSTDGAGA